MIRFPRIDHLLILILSITAALGCGVLPSGQVSTRSFTVTGFKLPVQMVAYTGSGTIPTEVPGIATNKQAAKGFVERTVMQTVFNILEQQGRSALLSDTVISSILSQLGIQINYDPLECKGATLVKNERTMITGVKDMIPHCIIVGSTVTALCGMKGNNKPDCMMPPTLMDIEPIPTNHTSFSGTLMTTNIIMANWSKEMWQRVVNRAVRMLAAGPFVSQFISAFATVN